MIFDRLLAIVFLLLVRSLRCGATGQGFYNNVDISAKFRPEYLESQFSPFIMAKIRKLVCFDFVVAMTI